MCFACVGVCAYAEKYVAHSGRFTGDDVRCDAIEPYIRNIVY